jgi:hypothetical protein
MPNNLRAALTAAGLQPGVLADLVAVDERTVRRWLAGGTPYARHRRKLARALDTTEHALWPELTTGPRGDATVVAPPVADTIIAHTKVHASDTPTTQTLIASALTRVDLIDTTGDLARQSELIDLLISKARDGCQVRILVSAPDRSLAPLLATPGIEICLSELDEQPVIHRADDHTLAWLTLRTTGDDDQAPVLLDVRHDGAPGTFARLADHYERAWELAQPIATTDELDRRLLDYETDDTPDDDHDLESVTDQRAPARAHQPGRRWPGRTA